jgi:formamidopyrimidine-DNA glycosylase
MPEVRELRDMTARAHACLRGDTPQLYKIQLHPDHLRTNGLKDHTRRPKLPYLSPQIQHQVLLSPAHVRYHGKSMLIDLQPAGGEPSGQLLEIQFFLQGHMLVIKEKEMKEIEDYWASLDKAGFQGQRHPHIGMCLRAVGAGDSLIFLDHNKLMTIELWDRDGSFASWKPLKHGPDSTQQPHAFAWAVKTHQTKSHDPLVEYMGKQQNIFCGLGQCLINETLHIARIHPLTPANMVFKQGAHAAELRQRITEAVEELVKWFTSESYRKHVSATRSATSAFNITRGCTQYILGNTQVYRKTGPKGAKVAVEFYDKLRAAGQVGPIPVVHDKLRLKVYMCRWRRRTTTTDDPTPAESASNSGKAKSASNSGKGKAGKPERKGGKGKGKGEGGSQGKRKQEQVDDHDEDDDDEKEEEEEEEEEEGEGGQEKITWKYCYTVIEDIPQQQHPAIIAEKVSRLGNDGKLSPEYSSKALSHLSNKPDIGISSFYYLLTSAEAVKRVIGRPARQTGGSRGKPNKSSLPSYLTFGQKQALIHESMPSKGIGRLARVARMMDGDE